MKLKIVIGKNQKENAGRKKTKDDSRSRVRTKDVCLRGSCSY